MDTLDVTAKFPIEGHVVLEVGGFVDTNTAPALERALIELGAAATRAVVLDLHSVDYVSSAGWGVMISVVSSLRDRGVDLRLAAMRPEVDQVYQLLEFPSILRSFPSVQEALEAKSASY